MNYTCIARPLLAELPLARCRRQLSKDARFLAAIAALQGHKDPLTALKLSGSLCDHLSYSFLVGCSANTAIAAMEHTDLKITRDQDSLLIVISGTVTQYKAATLICCTLDFEQELRELFYGLLAFFESVGLYEVWSDCRKRSPFLLEHKR